MVKHIGDEVMFVEVDAGGRVRHRAASWSRRFGDDAGVAPHAGLGFGAVVARGGDYYGSVVNLASRIADIAVPGEILVTEARRAAAAATDADSRSSRPAPAAEGLRRADPALVGHAIAPCSLSSAIRRGVEAPVGERGRRCRCRGRPARARPRPACGRSAAPGAGCGAPSTSVKVPRATLCGCARASFIVRTGREAHVVAGEELDPLVAGAGAEERRPSAP